MSREKLPLSICLVLIAIAGIILAARMSRIPHNPTGPSGAVLAPVDTPSGDDSIIASASLVSLDGKRIALSSYHGKWLLLNFWATWCGPCRMEMPDLKQIWQTQHPAGLQMLGVTHESPEDVWAFVHENTAGQSLVYPLAIDPDAGLSRSLDVDAIPRTIIMNPAGHIVFDNASAMAADDVLDALRKAGFRVAKALPSKPA